MSTEAFEDFFFNVCCLDYSRMDRAMDALVALMERTDRVRIVSPGTDLSFSIKGMPAIKCAGRLNIPDGEVYTAPVRESVNGVISYNTPSLENGFTYTGIRFVFRDGKHRRGHGQRHRAHQQAARHRRGRALCGRVRHRPQPVHHRSR